MDDANRRLAGELIEAIRQVAEEHDFRLDTVTDRAGKEEYVVTVKLARPAGSPSPKQQEE